MQRKQFLTGAAALAAAFVARGTARAATYPGPSDEAQLYENARKEGRLIVGIGDAIEGRCLEWQRTGVVKRVCWTELC